MAVSWLVLLIFLLYPLARVFGNVEGNVADGIFHTSIIFMSVGFYFLLRIVRFLHF